MQLVDEGDYFAVLGVAKSATSYEVRRAFLELRRAFEPSKLLTPGLGDLVEDVRRIASVLDEAYENLAGRRAEGEVQEGDSSGAEVGRQPLRGAARRAASRGTFALSSSLAPRVKPDPLAPETQQFARFRVVREIGRGAQGAILEGIDLERNARVAIEDPSRGRRS